MNSEYLDEEAITIVNNEYDYSNGIPTIESISYLVKYLDNVYKNFLNLIEEDEKKNLLQTLTDGDYERKIYNLKEN